MINNTLSIDVQGCRDKKKWNNNNNNNYYYYYEHGRTMVVVQTLQLAEIPQIVVSASPLTTAVYR